MAKKRRSKYARLRARLAGKKIPLEVGVAAISIPFTSPSQGWDTPWHFIQEGDIESAFKVLAKGFINLELDGSLNWQQAMNPFDMNAMGYTKRLLIAGGISMLRKKFLGRYVPIGRIPFLGKYVS